MAYKVFSNGDSLTGGELNTYLMNQAVISFASTTARDAALPSPSEGQLVWLEDSNKYVYYTGSAWADLITPAPSGNAIINGAFEINQRNFSSVTTSGAYMYDRFNTNLGGDGTSTYTPQTLNPADLNVSGFGDALNTLRVVTTGQTSAAVRTSFSQNVENVRTFAGQTVTLSFWAKAASGTPKVYAEISQIFGTGGSSVVSGNGSQVTLSTSWARYSVTINLASVSGKTIGANSFISPTLWVSAGTDFNARTGSLGIQSNTFDFWGIQLEAGSVATPFKRNAPSIQAELAACQRYYFRTTSGTNYAVLGLGNAISTTGIMGQTKFPTTMRVRPTAIEYGGLLQVFDGVLSTAVTTLAINADLVTSTELANYRITVASGLTQYRFYQFSAVNDAAAYIGFSAEL